jgi:intein/homing endonuclease
MKHKVKKRMFRIKSKDNYVDVTEDHSVIINRNDKVMSIKPIDIIKGDKIIEIIGVQLSGC